MDAPVNNMDARKVYDWLSFSQFQILPARCPLCNLRSPSGELLCRACRGALPRQGPACYQCGEASGHADGICGQCLRQPPPLARTLAPFRYDTPVRQLITAFKFRKRLDFGRLLGNLTLPVLRRAYREDPWPRCLLPVPLHPARLRQRHFNQSREIALCLGRGLQLPVRENLVRRVRDTRPQADLAGKDRRRNIRGAFAVSGPVPDHVALIDDVMTTGHTLFEIARLLRKAGCLRVDAWVLARAQPCRAR